MPAFIAAIGGMLINLVGTMAGRILVALGISVVTYTGVDTSLEWVKTQALQSFAMLPPDMISLISHLKVGVCISIITSAMATRALLNGVTGDTFKRWVMK